MRPFSVGGALLVAALTVVIHHQLGQIRTAGQDAQSSIYGYIALSYGAASLGTVGRLVYMFLRKALWSRGLLSAALGMVAGAVATYFPHPVFSSSRFISDRIIFGTHLSVSLLTPPETCYTSC